MYGLVFSPWATICSRGTIQPMGHYLLKGHYSAHGSLFAQGVLFSPWATICSRGTIQPMGHYLLKGHYSAHGSLFAQGVLFSPWVTICSRGTIQPMGHYLLKGHYSAHGLLFYAPKIRRGKEDNAQGWSVMNSTPLHSWFSTLLHEPNSIYVYTTHTQQLRSHHNKFSYNSVKYTWTESVAKIWR